MSRIVRPIGRKLFLSHFLGVFLVSGGRNRVEIAAGPTPSPKTQPQAGPGDTRSLSPSENSTPRRVRAV